MDEPFPFRFRLNCIDHYQATPTELDPQFHREHGLSQGKNTPQVAVIRVFGATETGQKVCAHVHGALPYLYIEYDGSLDADEVDSYVHNLRVSVDHALAISYRRNAFDGRAAYVAHISLVKGVPFYGYHVGYKFYLKIYLLNPLHMTRLADLLQQGAIMKRVFQPHESHLQYLLQWMCDFNLYGCAYIDCANARFRDPIPDYLELNNSTHKWHDRSIHPDWILSSEAFPRQSHCSIEVDICVKDILNRTEIKERPLHHDFAERLSDLDSEEKFVHSMAGLWRDETRRRKLRMGITDPTSSPFPPEVLISMSANARDDSKGGWIHEEEYEGLVRDLIGDESKKMQADGAKPLANEVKTALESVEDLFPENLAVSFKEEPLTANGIPVETAVVVVDEANISQVHDNDSEYDSDEETAKATAMTQTNQAKNHETSSGSTLSYVDGVSPGTAGLKAGARNTDGTTDLAGGNSSNGLSSSNDDSTRAPPVGSSSGVKTRLNEGSNIDGPGLMGSGLSLEEQRYIKRRRLRHTEHTDALGQEDCSMSNTSLRAIETPRRVAFQDDRNDCNSDPQKERQSSQHHQELFSLSQLSQSSIKAQGINSPTKFSFSVVKHHHDNEQRNKLADSNQKVQTSRPNTISAHSGVELPMTPWTTQKSTLRPVTPQEFRADPRALRLAAQMATVFDHASTTRIRCFGNLPPGADFVEATMADSGLPPVIYQNAYYSEEKDVPERPREYAGREFKLESITVPYLPEFDPTGTSPATLGEKQPVLVDRSKENLVHRRRRNRCGLRNWEFAAIPPTYGEVEAWLPRNKINVALRDKKAKVQQAARTASNPRPSDLSQIDGPTQKNRHGFKYSQKDASTSVQHDTQYMSIMSLEVHVNSRGNFVPDPAEDEIACVFWCIQADDDEEVVTNNRSLSGILALSDESGIAQKIARQVFMEVEYEEDELDLINRMVDIVRQLDPDILTGYEVHNGSWGYLIERARQKYEFNLPDEFSRMRSHSHGRFGKDADTWGFTHTSTIRITGRHMINIWRAMRGELNLLQYTMENVVFHLLHKRIPHYTFADLTRWYQSSRPCDLAKTLSYFLSRIQLNLQILSANELVSRTSEQARLLGVDFFSVFSRGSQFKVESLMFRIAKPENFILVSPSRRQVGQQNALECLPLVMEPQSAFYPGPLLVLDFQSLYPSVMIAYNYCYSTCLGRIVSWRGQNKMGFSDFKRELGLLGLVKDHINIAPNGIMYVKPEMRKSLLAKMLGEILETRVMVKSGMKVDKDDKTLQQLLNNRQLALKLIANVTYGYTSASFSGRMPCSEIADSIVQTGRETLEKAIALIHSITRWGAEVVYGDTDSLFVHLKGRTKAEAFAIGKEIADAVTNANPRPIKLKFEKVYFPCVLLAKKRYVGFKYENPAQKEPDFDAKGIETVRRDGTPAEQKIEEKALKILFRTSDLSEVKRYFQHQCTKIMSGRISIQDFLFAKEVKLGTYNDKGPPPPGALIATKRMLEDHRAEPQHGERVPYVVITGAPGARLIDRCVAPERLLEDENVELDAEYYISKNLIPPLERIFNLVGANVRGWYDEMPKVQRVRNVNLAPQGHPGQPLRKTLESYLKSSNCLVCRSKLALPPPNADIAIPPLPLCEQCAASPLAALLALKRRLQRAEIRMQRVDVVCRSCSGLAFGEQVRCDSRDCPVFYTRVRERAALNNLEGNVAEVLKAVEDVEGKNDAFEW